jgi:hypothetical protein
VVARRDVALARRSRWPCGGVVPALVRHPRRPGGSTERGLHPLPPQEWTAAEAQLGRAARSARGRGKHGADGARPPPPPPSHIHLPPVAPSAHSPSQVALPRWLRLLQGARSPGSSPRSPRSRRRRRPLRPLRAAGRGRGSRRRGRPSAAERWAPLWPRGCAPLPLGSRQRLAGEQL